MLVHTLDIFETTTSCSPHMRQIYAALANIMGKNTGRVVSAF